MARRLVPIAVALLVLLAVPVSGGGGISGRKSTIDARLHRVQAKIAWADRRRRELSAQVAEVNSQIQSLSRQVGDVSARLVTIERDLALHQEKLDKLNALFKVETERYFSFRHQYDITVERLDNRLVDIYENGDPTELDVLLSAKSFSDLISDAEFAESVNHQDERIAGEVGSAKVAARAQRERTKVFRAAVASETHTIDVRREQVSSARETLLAEQHGLAAARQNKRESLVAVTESKREYVHEAAGLAQASAQLASRLSGASSYHPGPPSGAGFIWPVTGPVTSPFGWRWGRMHEGIDIGVPTGTPIHASAAGKVVYAGWMSGYGNLVAIDHGNGLSTAYGHQERVAVSVGQVVAQGQVIGYSDCTGHCFGPHVHFEVRVNGNPVDPLSYL
jgi:murein DD-endopeptidase MepM/ murein hydrolase activator NlpD